MSVQTRHEERSGEGTQDAVQTAAEALLVDPNDRRGVRQAIFRLAGPSLVEMVLINVAQMLNMVMVGRVGAEAVASVGLTMQPFFLFMALFMALNVGTTVIVARSVGSGRMEEANRASGQAFLMNLAASVLMSTLGFIYAGGLLRIMGASEEVLAHGLRYAQIIFLSFGFTNISVALAAILRGAGDTRTPMKINVLANVLVVVLGYPLIYGLAGFPRMGVTGAAVATIIAQFLSMVWVVFVLFDGRHKIRIAWKDMKPFDKEMSLRILRIGFPTSLEQIIFRLGMLIFVKVAASLGTVALAGTQIAFTIMGLTFMPGMAFSIAASTLVGQALGAGKPELAELYGWQVRKFGAWVAGAIGLLFVAFPYQIMLPFTDDPGVIEAGGLGVRILGFIQISQATAFILAGALRGAGDTKFPLYSTFICVWGFRVALSLVFVFVFRWGLIGLWVAAAVDQLMRSVLISRRFKNGKWKTIRV